MLTQCICRSLRITPLLHTYQFHFNICFLQSSHLSSWQHPISYPVIHNPFSVHPSISQLAVCSTLLRSFQQLLHLPLSSNIRCLKQILLFNPKDVVASPRHFIQQHYCDCTASLHHLHPTRSRPTLVLPRVSQGTRAGRQFSRILPLRSLPLPSPSLRDV